MKIMNFGTEKDLIEYLDSLRSELRSDFYETAKKLLPQVFSSSLLDDPNTMQKIIRYFSTYYSKDLVSLVNNNFSWFGDVDLSVYKFCTLFGVRGMHDEENLSKYVESRLTTRSENDKMKLLTVIRHKSFPKKIKLIAFKDTHDKTLLDQKIQDLLFF